jgi:hypothetical protein
MSEDSEKTPEKNEKETDRTQICVGSKEHLGLGFPCEPILVSGRL